MYVNEGCTPVPASLSRASTVSELLLSSTSALCNFYPQLQVSTHHPKINTLQLRFVSSCKGDTFFPAQYTFAHYWHDGLVLCRVQRRLRHPCCITYCDGILSINCHCILFDDCQSSDCVGRGCWSLDRKHSPSSFCRRLSLSLSNRELIRLSASGIDPRLALCSFRFSSSKLSWIAVLIAISSWGTTVSVCNSFFFEFFISWPKPHSSVHRLNSNTRTVLNSSWLSRERSGCKTIISARRFISSISWCCAGSQWPDWQGELFLVRTINSHMLSITWGGEKFWGAGPAPTAGSLREAAHQVRMSSRLVRVSRWLPSEH